MSDGWKITLAIIAIVLLNIATALFTGGKDCSPTYSVPLDMVTMECH